MPSEGKCILCNRVTSHTIRIQRIDKTERGFVCKQHIVTYEQSIENSRLVTKKATTKTGGNRR